MDLENQPLVSVVVPVHNAEKTLTGMLDSLCAQTWKALQILVVDDGSTDQTLALARAAAARDPRITVLTQPNLGVSVARNTALEHCKGTFIRFADGDDTMPADSMERLVSRALRDEADLVIGGYTEYVGRVSRFRNRANRADIVSCEKLLELLCPHSNTYFYGVLWNKLFCRAMVEENRIRFPAGLTWGEDFSFVVAYLHHAEKIAFLRESVYDYRRNPESASVTQVWDSVIHPLANIRIKRQLYGRLKDLYVARGVYPAYRGRLWLYLFRVGLS